MINHSRKSRRSIVVTLAMTALAGSAASSAGPFCANKQRHMGPAIYPYTAQAPYPTFSPQPPVAQYSAPYAGTGHMAGPGNWRLPAPMTNSGGPVHPVMPEAEPARPVQAKSASSSTPDKAVGENITVRIDGMRFEPARITVKPGTTVTWIHNGRMPHTVTGELDGPSSKTLNAGQQYSHTFTAAGSYQYTCDFHPSMKGQVIVERDGIGT